jgi:hypothetical protein
MLRLSVIVPTTKPGGSDHCLIAQAEAIQHDISIQFIFLINSGAPHNPLYRVSHIGKISVIEVGNDRYYGTCEENLFRVRDVITELGEYILCVGDHDEVNWSSLVLALVFCKTNNIDVLGLNLNNVTILQNK